MTAAAARVGHRPAGRVSLMAVIAGLAELLTGCLSGHSLLVRRELVVNFAPSAYEDQRLHDAVRRACSGIPTVLTERPGPGMPPEYNVVYDISRTGDRQLSALYACLGRQPGVVGAHIDQASGP